MTTPRGNPDSLANLLSTFARSIQEQAGPHATLVEIVRAAVELVPGCDEGSISLVAKRRLVTSEAASGELARTVDSLQEKFREGPCVDAAFHEVTVRVPDMATETRWPSFGAAAYEAGAASMLALRLYVEGDNLGALNLISRRSEAFDDESEHIGDTLAAHAAVAFASAQQHEKLTRSVRTHQVVGQAQGILMERHKLTETQAYAVLVRASQQTQVKLRDLAAQLVHSGELN